ncbi:uncharacterized protein LOC110180427 [Drosophila serrata]|uniref:uncharacterized protein LOC110180427 n=1 Tax=Drosophila serrata TaxID=7274 RepID=UPI000A1D07CC|nr:uncharacterized protein LOC110180427 [Drosophila serrata]
MARKFLNTPPGKFHKFPAARKLAHAQWAPKWWPSTGMLGNPFGHTLGGTRNALAWHLATLAACLSGDSVSGKRTKSGGGIPNSSSGSVKRQACGRQLDAARDWRQPRFPSSSSSHPICVSHCRESRALPWARRCWLSGHSLHAMPACASSSSSRECRYQSLISGSASSRCELAGPPGVPQLENEHLRDGGGG